MPKFEKRYVHLMWDDELEGQTVFFADDIYDLQRDVEINAARAVVIGDGSQQHPFKVKMLDDAIARPWRFIYHDPFYELKLSHEQGNKIECKRKGEAWEDWNYTPNPEWLDDYEYRIMQEEENPVTNRELSKWLAQGNGEYYWYDEDGFVSECGTELQYPQANANDKVIWVKIRKWNDDEWHEPTRAYLGLEE